MVGGAAVLPLAPFGIVVGELIGIGGEYLTGYRGAMIGTLIGGIAFSGGIVLRGACVGAQIGEPLIGRKVRP